jgi:hypothetical protein
MLIVANLVLAAANNIPEVFLGALLWACELYHQLELDQFFSQRLAPSRKGTRWDLIANPGLLSAIGSWQRVASASAVIRR